MGANIPFHSRFHPHYTRNKRYARGKVLKSNKNLKKKGWTCPNTVSKVCGEILCYPRMPVCVTKYEIVRHLGCYNQCSLDRTNTQVDHHENHVYDTGILYVTP